MSISLLPLPGFSETLIMFLQVVFQPLTSSLSFTPLVCMDGSNSTKLASRAEIFYYLREKDATEIT